LLQRSTFLVVVLLTLSACSRYGNLADDSLRQGLWAEQQVVAAEVTQWNLYARAVLRIEGGLYNIGIRWQRQENGRFMMLLDAPLGQGVLRIDALGPEEFRLRLPDGQLFVNNTVEALMVDVVGWSLPIGGLDYWIRGLPYPGDDYRHRLDSTGRAKSIRQAGWDIAYLDYFAEVDEPSLPRKLTLTSEDVTLKLVIERWQQAPGDASGANLFPSFE
jgi:outer membrane lipoprotein LolB